jgi:hypothetical protein
MKVKLHEEEGEDEDGEKQLSYRHPDQIEITAAE